MKDRQEHIDFDRNYCTHYAPKPGAALKDDYCALGCDASAMMKKSREMGGQPRMAPCIGGHECADVHAICPTWERRSLEHAEKRADAIEKSMKQLTIASPFISAWRKKEPIGKSEVVEIAYTSPNPAITATCARAVKPKTASTSSNEIRIQRMHGPRDSVTQILARP